MTEFKKGDRVTWTEFAGEESKPTSEWYNLRVGITGTVTRDFRGSQHDLVNVWWDNSTNGTIGYFPRRLQLAATALTDEDLAAKYREVRKTSLEYFDELARRGYAIRHGGHIVYNYSDPEVSISKIVEEEVVVTEIKKVKKEI